MFSQLIGLIAVIILSYVFMIFVAPNIADQYGNGELNAKIRNIKDESLNFASGSDSLESLFEKIKNTTTPYIENTKTSYDTLNSTVDTKVEQVKDTAKAVENAYTGIIDATQKIQNLTGTGK
ncbi:hypothetical protein H7169_03510 [Candidatus Gracilibacteria bacterium]|nr:hypothetical protein [Candidatus Gracilibacteria bacterium]